MNVAQLKNLLQQFKEGSSSLEETLTQLKAIPFQDLGFAKIDHHRSLRCGFPEVIFSERKTIEEFSSIAENILARNSDLLATRASAEQFSAVQSLDSRLEYHSRSRLITLKQEETKAEGNVIIISAGTSDLPVAEEALITAKMMDCQVQLLTDLGVAGLHRLLPYIEPLQQANAVVVVAGMEGALAPVIGGLVDCPVIAVPTSVGYGAHFNGLAPLLAMLNSCAAGISVVNIDNGFGAGYSAALINQKIVQAAKK